MITAEFPTEKITALHGHLRLRGGRMSTASIAVAVLGETTSDYKGAGLERILRAEAERLDIEPVEMPGDGLYWQRRPAATPAPAPKTQPAVAPAGLRDWSKDGILMVAAREIAKQMGAEGVSPGRTGLPTGELVRRLSERMGETITPNAFAPSSAHLGGKWRNTLEAHYEAGRKNYLAKVAEFQESKEAGEDPDAAPSILAPTGPLPEPEELSAEELQEAITELREIACSSSNGSHPPDDEPTDEDLNLVEEVAGLEQELEEAKREIEALQEALQAASKAADVSTHQDASQGTLDALLAALEAQLTQAQHEQAEAETKVAAISEKLTAARQLVQVLEG